MRNVVIAGYARSAFTPAEPGDLRKVRPDELAAQVVPPNLAITHVASAQNQMEIPINDAVDAFDAVDALGPSTARADRR